MSSLRLVSFNVQHGLGRAGFPDPGRLATALAGLDADVVALQEVDRGQDRSGRSDLLAVAAAATGATDVRFVPTLTGQVDLRTPVDKFCVRAASSQVNTRSGRRRARGDEQSGPAYGIALVSRLPVRTSRRLRLPCASPQLRGRQLGADEPRAAIAAVVDTRDGPLTVVATHLSNGRRWNLVQLRALRHHLRRAPRPLVLVGDLNIRGTTAARATGWNELVRVPTYPAPRPFLAIDHVLADGPVTAAVPARALDLGTSDHRAVVVDLHLDDLHLDSEGSA